jgi:hypothetical protein
MGREYSQDQRDFEIVMRLDRVLPYQFVLSLRLGSATLHGPLGPLCCSLELDGFKPSSFKQLKSRSG